MYKKTNGFQENKESVNFELIWGGYKQHDKNTNKSNNLVKKLKL